MERNCIYCLRSRWAEDVRTGRKRRRCIPNAMWVNRRMHCEEGLWPERREPGGVSNISAEDRV